MKLHKLSGAGNDFLAWAEGAPDRAPEPAVADMIAWCRRGLSVGADGFLVLRRQADGVRVIHRDADGSRPELCLNGARCAVELAASLGWGDGDQVRLITDCGPVDGVRIHPGRCRVTVPRDFVDEPSPLSLVVDGTIHDGHLVRVGGPHFVLPWPDLDSAPVLTLGAALRHHPDLGTAGANVHFVSWRDGAIHLRSFERGVEGETLACGTGSLAAVLVGESLGYLPRGLTQQAHAHTWGGFRLGIGRDSAGRLTLEGDARRVAVVDVLEGASPALDRPSPPAARS